MAKYDTDELIASVKRRGFIPAAQATFSSDDFLKAASEEQEERLVPFVLSARGEFWVVTSDTAIVAGQSVYPVPSRAVGNKLRNVSLIIPGGGYRKLPQIQLEDLDDLGINVNSGTPQCFYMLDNSVVVFPTPALAYGTLRMAYYLKPNRLVATSAVGVVQGFDAVPKNITLVSSIGTLVTGAMVDIISGTPPFNRLQIDQPISSGTDAVLGMTNALPSALKAGDIVALSGETSFPNMPPEIHPILAQLGAANIVSSMGDFEMGDRMFAKAEAALAKVMTALSSRVDGRGKKIVNRVWL